MQGRESETEKEEKPIGGCGLGLDAFWATVTHFHWDLLRSLIKRTTQLSTQRQNTEMFVQYSLSPLVQGGHVNIDSLYF